MVVATNSPASENPNQKEKKIPLRQAFLLYRTNISFSLAYFKMYIIWHTIKSGNLKGQQILELNILWFKA